MFGKDYADGTPTPLIEDGAASGNGYWYNGLYVGLLKPAIWTSGVEEGATLFKAARGKIGELTDQSQYGMRNLFARSTYLALFWTVEARPLAMSLTCL